MDMGEWRRDRVRRTQRAIWKPTIPHVKQTANGNLLCDPGDSNGGPVTIPVTGVRCRGSWEALKGGDLSAPMSDPYWCTSENHKILQSNYPLIKKTNGKKILFKVVTKVNSISRCLQQLQHNIKQVTVISTGGKVADAAFTIVKVILQYWFAASIQILE